MTKVYGLLGLVTDKPAHVSEVWVRSPKVRTYMEGVVTTGNDRVPVTNGEVLFEAVPGPAALTLVAQGEAVDVIPILVGDVAEQTLSQAVSAAEVADEATQREIERLAAQAVELIDSSTENARKAQDGATRAETAASRAASSQEEAKLNESASWSARNQSSTYASNAGKSAAEASADAGKASKSASDAAGSASAAKKEADRAATIAGSTMWVGTKLEVNGKRSPDLMPKLEVSSRDTWVVNGTDTGRPARGPGGVSAWEEVSGKPSAFPPEAHNHSFTDITDLPTISTGTTPGTLVKRDGKGNIAASDPSYNWHAATKKYVDNAISNATPPPSGWDNVTGKPSTFPPASHQHVSDDVTDASNDIGKGKGGKVVKSRNSDGKVFTYTPISDVSDSRELVSKGWVDSRVAEVQADLAAQPKVQVVSSIPTSPDPNTLYLVG